MRIPTASEFLHSAPRVPGEMGPGPHGVLPRQEHRADQCSHGTEADLGAPQHNIEPFSSNLNTRLNSHKLATPYSEAIEQELEEYVDALEKADAFEHLNNQHHRVCALNAAAIVGDLQLINRIMTRYGDELNPTGATYAMSVAILNDHDAVFRRLLEAGTEVRMRTSSFPRPPDPLFAALLRRRESMAMAILEAGTGDEFLAATYYHCLDYRLGETPVSGLLDVAIQWGNRDILLRMKICHPYQCVRNPSEALQQYPS